MEQSAGKAGQQSVEHPPPSQVGAGAASKYCLSHFIILSLRSCPSVPLLPTHHDKRPARFVVLVKPRNQSENGTPSLLMNTGWLIDESAVRRYTLPGNSLFLLYRVGLVMDVSAVLSLPEGLVLKCIKPGATHLTISVYTTAPTAECPFSTCLPNAFIAVTNGWSPIYPASDGR